jgi:hypothetical protein
LNIIFNHRAKSRPETADVPEKAPERASRTQRRQDFIALAATLGLSRQSAADLFDTISSLAPAARRNPLAAVAAVDAAVVAHCPVLARVVGEPKRRAA